MKTTEHGRFRLGRHEQVAREALHLGSGGKSEVGLFTEEGLRESERLLEEFFGTN